MMLDPDGIPLYFTTLTPAEATAREIRQSELPPAPISIPPDLALTATALATTFTPGPPTPTAEPADRRATRRYLSRARSTALEAHDTVGRLRAHLDRAEADPTLFQSAGWWQELEPLVIRLHQAQHPRASSESVPPLPSNIQDQLDRLQWELGRLVGYLAPFGPESDPDDWQIIHDSIGAVQSLATALQRDIKDYARRIHIDLD